MKEIEANRTMTVEEILQDPSLAYMHDFVRKVENMPASQLIPRKHEKALTSVTTMETRTREQMMSGTMNQPPVTKKFQTLESDAEKDSAKPAAKGMRR